MSEKDRDKKTGKAKPGDDAEKSVATLAETPEVSIGSEMTNQIEAISPEIRPEALSFMAMFKSQIGSLVNPIFEKMTPDNINTYLQNMREEVKQDFELKKGSRWYNLVYFIAILGAVIFLVVYLIRIDKDLMLRIIEMLMAFGGGFGAGYGMKARFNSQGE